MQRSCDPGRVDEAIKRKNSTHGADIIKSLPSVHDNYQSWYSEAKALVRQLLPDRLGDFVPITSGQNSQRNHLCQLYDRGLFTRDHRDARVC